MNLVLKKEKYILGKIGLNFRGFGEQLNKFWGFGEHKQKRSTFRELRQKIRDLGGRSEHYFQGAREQGPPLLEGPPNFPIANFTYKMIQYLCFRRKTDGKCTF